MWCDFHIHSNFSDGVLSIPQIVDLYGQQGFGAIAVTDHLCEDQSFLGKAAKVLERTLTPETFPSYMELLESEADRAWDQYRMLLIPGVEITKNTFMNSRSAHMLILGLDQLANPNLDFQDLCQWTRQEGGLSVVAHPVNTGKKEKQTYHLWSRRQELASLVDAWEVASGRILFDEVLNSGLPILANSDLHRPWQLESWKTFLGCEKNQGAIFDAIRKQKIQLGYFKPRELKQNPQVIQLDPAC